MLNGTLRFATEADIPLLLSFIRQLAVYEKMEDQVVADAQTLRVHMFERRRAEALLALDETGQPVGFALFCHHFSTFLGRAGLYLEDLFVLPAYRGRGYGKALLQALARIAVQRECGRLEWACLDWNAPSIAFYRAMGAQGLADWTTYRLAGERLVQMAAGAPAIQR